MIKVNWDVEELVALIDIYRRSENKTRDQIEVELQRLSNALNFRADTLGIKHDEKYRNISGMKMMFQNVVFIATDGGKGMSSVSNSMRQVYDLQRTSPEVFNMILQEFSKRYY